MLGLCCKLMWSSSKTSIYSTTPTSGTAPLLGLGSSCNLLN